ncbi:MAG: hypothetical protein GWN21_07240 [Gammaproteobacteria bacterium]|nr:hypothetical protein [Gammaproteobacteria bacterium]NIP88529.1 hypothetical protein [Gammaproteobacteria bacterium]NIR23250.1 hypothetical protein [Gammaproteobacteria bacterium]NIS04821.1 hypothetical protein [Gammaproteobacteria bacterium]NIU40099.1 hypothetical protein [Gammaproteobacteria bacterium]
MERGFIFWKQDLRVSGSRDVGSVAGRIRSLITVSGITINERLIGAIEGDSIRVWRTAPLAQAGDIVEFRGVLRTQGDESVIEGSVAYNLRTKFQFVGCLVLGLFLTLIGLVNWMRDLTPGMKLAAVGAIVTVATLLWIYSSRRLVWKQIAFIEEQLAKAVAA